MISSNELKEKPKEFLAATSLTVPEFEQLVPRFGANYRRLYPPELTSSGRPRRRRAGGGSVGVLASDANKLFFILVYCKTNPLQTMHGLQFGLSQSQTNYWIHRLLPVLEHTLRTAGHAPERDGQQVETSPLAQEGGLNLALDGTERRQQRPQDELRQKELYSGKKKTHSHKHILLVNENTCKVVYLGPTEPGKKHDKKAADTAAIHYPLRATVAKDTGFQGYEPTGVVTYQPQKKPRGQELSVSQRVLNRVLASVRVVVEHAIAGVKRCRIVKDILRLTRSGVSDQLMEIACGLHNFRVTCRHPLPTVDLLALANGSPVALCPWFDPFDR